MPPIESAGLMDELREKRPTDAAFLVDRIHVHENPPMSKQRWLW
ncbi:MAG: hypothetical protein ACXVAT_19245 [Isosphaeraceae bacterium]